jgi:hypothetical protein
MDSFSRSWSLVKASFAVLRTDPKLMLFPLISMIGVLIVTAVYSLPIVLTGTSDSLYSDRRPSLLGWALLFSFYLVMYTIIIYANVALVGAAMLKLKGQEITLGDGLRIANERLGNIIAYAAISATLGVVLRMLRDRLQIVGFLIAGLANLAWDITTFLVVPVLVVENVGPIEAIKRSGNLLRRTWGEQIIGNVGVGLAFFLIFLGVTVVVALPLIIVGTLLNSMVLVIASLVLLAIFGVILGVVGSALDGVFRATLYQYANTGNSGSFFDEGLVQTAFRPKTR